jgi:RNA polymerase sigma-70 factor, ECF subfamily
MSGFLLDLSVEEHMSTVTMFEATRKMPLENLGQIFEEYYDLTYRTAFGITRTAEDAEDVVQAIFLQLLRREAPPDLTKNPKGYFYRAAVNLSLRTLRSRKRHVLTDNSEQFESSGESTKEADEAMDQRLWNAIAELNEGPAQILVLRYVHGYRISDVAKLTGTTRSAVAVSLFRSRARLKKLIRASQEQSHEA